MAKKHTHTAKPATPEQTSGERFLATLSESFNASIGVVVVRTNETYRALRLLHELHFQRHPNEPFRKFDSVRGWATLTLDGSPSPTHRDEPPGESPVGDLRRIDDPPLPAEGETPKERWATGVFVMLDFYKVLVTDSAPFTPVCRMLQEYMENFPSTEQRLVLLMPDSFVLPPSLQGVLKVVDLDLPVRAELRETLENVIDDACPEGQTREFPFDDRDTEMLLDSALGLSIHEAENAFAVPIARYREDWEKNRLTATQMNEVVLAAKTESLKHSQCLELMTPVPMAEVAGMELIKEYILDELLLALNPDARRFGIDAPKGFAIIGPPGNGKSLIAKALADYLRVALINFKFASVHGSLLGESQGKMAASLKLIAANAPAVVLIDEADKAIPDPRGYQGDSGAGRQVFGQLLTFMQENTKPIIWVLTANWAENFDPALLRKGRVDDVFGMTLPTPIERLQAVKIHLRKRKQDPDLKGLERFTQDECYGMVFSELEAMVNSATKRAYRLHKGKGVLLEDLQVIRETLRPISETQASDFAKMEQWIAANARPCSIADEKEAAKRALQYAATPQDKLKIETKLSVEKGQGPDFGKKNRPRRPPGE